MGLQARIDLLYLAITRVMDTTWCCLLHKQTVYSAGILLAWHLGFVEADMLY